MTKARSQRSDLPAVATALQAGARGQRPAASGQRSDIRCQSSEYALRSTLHALRAFTLIELLVVIVVIAILVGITLPVSKYAIYRAKQARQDIMLAKMRSALDDYRATYGEYPITPTTNASNYDAAIRHYPDNYPTECYYTTNSPYTKVYLTSSGTVEQVHGYPVDYCLTYPLMLRQLDKGARPFYEFPEITVVSLVYRGKNAINPYTIYKRQLGGGLLQKEVRGLYGNPVNRAEAIDPISRNQWKYVCTNGMHYYLMTNSF